MYLFFIIYGVSALVFFIFFEVVAVISRREENAKFIKPIYQINHFKTTCCAVFFPIVTLIILIGVITECILDRSGNK